MTEKKHKGYVQMELVLIQIDKGNPCDGHKISWQSFVFTIDTITNYHQLHELFLQSQWHFVAMSLRLHAVSLGDGKGRDLYNL